MKFGFGKSIFFMSIASLASAMFARGLISVIQYDIFAKCINDPEAATSYMCRNANDLLQVITFAVAALVMFAILFVFWRNPEMKRRTTIHAGILSLLFFGMLVAVWQITVGLQDNFIALFQFKRGVPSEPSEYGYYILNRLGDVIIGVILGFLAWAPYATKDMAIDAKDRKEPRLEFGSAKEAPEADKTAAATAAKPKAKAPAKKPAAKKKTAKKAPAKKKPAAKK